MNDYKQIRSSLEKNIFNESHFTIIQKSNIRNKLQKKRRYNLVPYIVLALFLVTLSGFLYLNFNSTPPPSHTVNGTYEAKAVYLKEIQFVDRIHKGNTLNFSKGKLTIVNNEIYNAIKPNMDTEDLAGLKNNIKVISNIKINTKGDTFYITGDENFSMTLQIIAPRIVMDEKGNEYSTSTYLE
ncbi:hypothetical protein ACIQ4I_02210 [Rummeliibacillus sp. NPDC094406]|uniref:hypothetical protein n=1 Tax=Rummeliibacillus sp. NPDC094406 TaxID=3364511 RepID=UPI003809EEAF